MLLSLGPCDKMLDYLFSAEGVADSVSPKMVQAEVINSTDLWNKALQVKITRSLLEDIAKHIGKIE